MKDLKDRAVDAGLIDEAGEPLWYTRASGEFALRGYAGTKRVLMHRWADENGHDHKGNEVPWRDIATFDSYNDAEMVLRILQGGNQ